MSRPSSSAPVSTNEGPVLGQVRRWGPMREESEVMWGGGEDCWLSCQTLTPPISLHMYYVLFTANNLMQSLGILQYFRSRFQTAEINRKILPIWLIRFLSVIEAILGEDILSLSKAPGCRFFCRTLRIMPCWFWALSLSKYSPRNVGLILVKMNQPVNDTELMIGLDCSDLKRLLRAFFWGRGRSGVKWSEVLHFCVTAPLITSYFIIICK